MEYTKITCSLNPDNELARELLISELSNAGFESFVETDEAVEAYIKISNSMSFWPISSETFC